MASHTSPSGASSKITFEFTESSADINSLTPVSIGASNPVEPTKPAEKPVTPTPTPTPTPVKPSTETTTEVPNTGFFTGSDGIDPAPLAIFGIVLLVVASVVAILYKRRPRAHRDLTIYTDDRLAVRDIRTSGKRTIIGLSALFSFCLALGIVFPQFIAPASDEDSSALDGYIELELASTERYASAKLGSKTTLALTSQTISCSSSSYEIYVNVAEDSTNGNYLFLGGDTSKGYIAPTSGSLTNKKTLSANEWGFTTSSLSAARNNGSIWAAVPLYGVTSAGNKIHSSSDTNKSTTITFGAAGLKSSTPAGAHSQTIVYTAVRV